MTGLWGCQASDSSGPQESTSGAAASDQTASNAAPSISDKSATSEMQSGTKPEQAASNQAAQATSSADSADQQAPQSSASNIDQAVQQKLASMSLEEKVAQMFIPHAESLCSDGSTLLYVDDDVKSNLATYPVGGISILDPNFTDPDQALTLTSELQKASQEATGLDLLLCIDEEGGTVARLGMDPAFPVNDPGDMRVIGDSGNTQAAYDAAKTIGTYVKEYGCNVDFAPVADTDNPSGGTMYQRSFGSDYNVVASMVEQQVRGFQDAGVMSCAKHFPGIGAAVGDSHEVSITTSKTLEQMLAEDLVPFQAAIDAGVPMVMIGHISCPNITGDNIPATFSPAIITGVLRNEMGFNGVVVTDSLAMGAATAVYGDADAAVRAITAGADMLLMPPSFHTAYQGVLSAVGQGTITEERINESVERILRMKYEYAA